MTRKNLLPFSRRGFIKLIGSISVLLMFSNPFQLYAGSPFTLIDFAQITDVHLVDKGNELRTEEVLSSGKYGLGKLLVESDIIPLPINHETDPFSVYNWDRIVRSINAEHRRAKLDFVISTGDHTDTNLENELKWFIEIANGGPLSAGYYNRTGKKDVYNFTDIAGFDKTSYDKPLPWYAALGNHDTEYQGTVGITGKGIGLNKLLAWLSKTYPYSFNDLCSQNDAINSYLGDSKGVPQGHGFANMPKSILGYAQEGYYSFNPADHIHCIVLNTANYRPEIIPGKPGRLETFAEGFLDARQFLWMKKELNENKNKLCIIFSHHPQPKMFSATKNQLEKTLSSYPNVIAHIAGHKHDNVIEPIKKSDGTPAYWRIRTNAAVRAPHEWRRFTVKVNDLETSEGTITTVVNAVESGAGDGSSDNRDREMKFKIPDDVKSAMNDQNKQTRKAMLKSFFKSIFGLKK